MTLTLYNFVLLNVLRLRPFKIWNVSGAGTTSSKTSPADSASYQTKLQSSCYSHLSLAISSQRSSLTSTASAAVHHHHHHSSCSCFLCFSCSAPPSSPLLLRQPLCSPPPSSPAG